MLNLIGDFLHEDTELRFIIEQQALIQIKKTLQSNLVYFKHFRSEIYYNFLNNDTNRYSVFCTKEEKLNIVENSSGRVLYSNNPIDEISTEIKSFCSKAPFVSLNDIDNPSLTRSLPEKSVIFCFGIGAGLHLLSLLREAKPKVLVVYQPEIDLFITSLSFINWAAVFDEAEQLGTQLSLQLGNNANSIAADIRELVQLLPETDSIYLYRHLTHPISDEVFNFLREYSGHRNKILHHKIQFYGYKDDALYIPERVNGVLANENYKELKQNRLFEKNVAVLSEYFPVLSQMILNYKPKCWYVIKKDQQFNLLCKKRHSLFYSDLDKESSCIVERHFKRPLDNQVILNQGGLEKFKTYHHFQAIKKLQPILIELQMRTIDGVVEKDDVDNLIIVGVGLGQHISMLLKKVKIKNLFVFEPNIDFFYASLFVTEWGKILKNAQKNHQHIYFNIGGTGDEYFSDLMGQYYQTGVYGIAKTQFLPAFLTPGMSRALIKLQSRLRITVASGENFDHARYGIAHTYNSLVKKHYFLKSNRETINLKRLVNLPVFIVGNGPSLDVNYQYIKEHRKNVIVVSCGTALRSLYSLGITPDFHAEIEQNRATYNWITQVEDLEWLKSISLISVNGIHPDSACLFKKVYLALKSGEASTEIFEHIFEQNNFYVGSLKNAYPTVSNLVLDFFTELKSKQIYLMGVDLGYINIEDHHSKHSAYYHSNGTGILNADLNFNTGLVVKGNFRTSVYTKPEFDLSRSIMELTIASSNKKTDFYNCSDGAFISGTVPLEAENIIVDTSADAAAILADTFDGLFYSNTFTECIDSFINKINLNDFTDIVSGLLDLSHPINSRTKAKQVIDSQWQYLANYSFKKDSIGTKLLYGSVAYILSILTRVLALKVKNNDNDDAELNMFNSILNVWREYLEQARESYLAAPLKFCDVDVSYSFKK